MKVGLRKSKLVTIELVNISTLISISQEKNITRPMIPNFLATLHNLLKIYAAYLEVEIFERGFVAPEGASFDLLDAAAGHLEAADAPDAGQHVGRQRAHCAVADVKQVDHRPRSRRQVSLQRAQQQRPLDQVALHGHLSRQVGRAEARGRQLRMVVLPRTQLRRRAHRKNRQAQPAYRTHLCKQKTN